MWTGKLIFQEVENSIVIDRLNLFGADDPLRFRVQKKVGFLSTVLHRVDGKHVMHKSLHLLPLHLLISARFPSIVTHVIYDVIKELGQVCR